jgi:CubicO group peptidase (beta-lactamase class C family)
MSLRTLLSISIIFIVSSTVVTNDNEIFVDDLMQDYDSNGTAVPGASVLVICKNVPVIRRSYGFASIAEGTRVIPATNFRLASVTKQFTAASILLLAEEKNQRLYLDDRIREKWLPTLPAATDAITIRHLLTHTSGLIDYEDGIDENDDPDQQLSDADVLKILETQNRTYFSPPGSRYRYSNSGYALLALIVEHASGKRFANFLHEQIFEPLQMNGSVAYEKGISTVVYRAFGHSYNGSSWIQTDQSRTSAVLGDGGIYSSIDDLVKWDTALYDNRLLSPESLKLAMTPAVRTDDPGIQYGMGWRISGEMIWHLGETIGFENAILRFPKQRLTVVVLTNRNGPGPFQAALTIAHRFLFSAECSMPCSGANSFICWKTLILFWLLIDLFFFIFHN